jgi:hypothetical protein
MIRKGQGLQIQISITKRLAQWIQTLSRPRMGLENLQAHCEIQWIFVMVLNDYLDFDIS